jgi:hypothetical protein
LTSLVKKIEAASTKDGSKLKSFVVFCTDEEGLDKKLKALAAKESIKKTIFTIDNPSGPQGYDIAKDADVTVLLYVNKTVKVNHAYKKGEFKDADVAKVLADLPKITGK